MKERHRCTLINHLNVLNGSFLNLSNTKNLSYIFENLKVIISLNTLSYTLMLIHINLRVHKMMLDYLTKQHMMDASSQNTFMIFLHIFWHL